MQYSLNDFSLTDNSQLERLHRLQALVKEKEPNLQLIGVIAFFSLFALIILTAKPSQPVISAPVAKRKKS